MWKIETSALAKAFYWFGLINGVMAFWVEYGYVNSLGNNQLFGDPVFHLLMGMLSIMAGIFINTERSNRVV